jgi:uncharacterized membrane protein
MTYALAALFAVTLMAAGAAVILAYVERSLCGLKVPLTSLF